MPDPLPDSPDLQPTGPTPSPEPSLRLVRLIPALLLILVAAYYLRVKVEIRDDRGAIPRPCEALLWRGNKSEKITITDGEVSLLRFHWDRLEVTDVSYIRTNIPLKGRNPKGSIERNTILKLKDAAHGLPSVPQRGD